MNALIRKEVRLVFPAWAGAMVLLLGAVFFAPLCALAALLYIIFGAGAILLALQPFGQECNLGTLSSMLVQPVPRQRFWRIKALVLAVALVSILCVLLFGYTLRLSRIPLDTAILPAQDVALVCGLIALTAYAGGLWTTLLLRQIAAAFWFTLLLPPAILVLTSTFLEQSSPPVAKAIISTLLVLYALAGILWARRQFLRAQDVQWTGGVIALPALQSLGAATGTAPRRRPLRALFWKEIQSHQSSFLVAGVLLVSHLVILLIRAAHRGSRPGLAAEVLLEFWWVFWLGLPLLLGSSSAAEERRLGTHQVQLCLPAGRRTQASIKFGVALLLGLFLGGFMPALIESFGAMFGSASGMIDMHRPGLASGQFFIVLCVISAGITLIAFHASTLARNTLQAVQFAVAAGLVLTPLLSWAATGEPAVSHGLHTLPLIAWVGAPILLIVVGGLAYYSLNCLRPGWTTWLLNGFAVGLALVFAAGATAAIHDRAWERLAPLDPRSGPTQLRGPIRPQILASGDVFVLLPDGRLWAPADYEFRTGYIYHEASPHGAPVSRTYQARIPADGTFIGGSNWVSIAGTYRGTVGLQQDGSLWNVFGSGNPERIGTDSDWKAIAAGHGFFVALKNNGTLWGWGNNHSGQLGHGPKEVTGEMVQIGTDEDWMAVFAASSNCTGIKRDGSVWKWGQLPIGPEGWQRWKGGPHPEPIRWPLYGSDWLHFESLGGFDLILRQDGSLWASGSLPKKLFGQSLARDFRVEPVQVGSSSAWAAVDVEFGSIAAIKAGKVLYQRAVHPPSVPWIQAIWTPTRRSDWIAVTPYQMGGCLALSADGTLSLWGHPAGPPAGFSGLLAPSRKPLWSINVLADTRAADL